VVPLLGLVTAVAIIGAACGSTKSSDAPGPTEGWQMSLTSASGRPLPQTEVQSGRTFPALVVGGTYVVTATVPSALRSKLAGKTVELQHRAGSDGEWTTVKEVRVGADGRIREEFTAGKELIHRHDYRIAVFDSGSSPTTEGAAAGDGGVRLMSVARPTLLPFVTSDPPLTAVAAVQFVVQVVNNTGNNLNLYIPTAQSNGTYNEGEVALASGETKSLLYTNPTPGSGVHFRVNKQKCLLGCTNYVMNWKWYPTEPETAQPLPGYTACGASMPQFTSNQVYKVELNDKMFPNSNFAAGLLSGQLGGDGTGYTTCTFDLESQFVNWLQSNPVKGFLIAAAAVALIVAAVALTVATAGAAAPLDAAAAELVADAVVEVIAEDAATDAAGDLAEPAIEAAEGALPDPAGPDYFEFGPATPATDIWGNAVTISNYVFAG